MAVELQELAAYREKHDDMGADMLHIQDVGFDELVRKFHGGWMPKRG
ncbi:hypothetical protein [Selenomonas flueggei]|uniref:Uncharacterized protein n=1 Tax=Selenomonas flueggei ATCC 43531 TaxID=638302 RepID=C4V1B9_9FIRM|nr:hypothetical protein [Selenomonas flueggei]EEQ49455.1 hypothetical protein HMPREF0908_0313 [Selenomonas flueggei ATCC 43531]